MCVFLFCLVMLNGIHGLCLFGFARRLDMLFVEGYTNLEEVGNALLLHRRNIGASDVWLRHVGHLLEKSNGLPE